MERKQKKKMKRRRKVEDNKKMVIYKDSFFLKIRNFFKNLFKFTKKPEVEVVEKTIPKPQKIQNQKEKFNEYISFKENKDDLREIEKVRSDLGSLDKMSLEELDEFERVVQRRQNYVNKKIAKLRTDLRMKKQV